MENSRSPDRDGTLAGFRLVRRIGTGSRSVVYLGQAAGEQGPTVTAALKVFRPDADRGALDRQVRAMLTVPPATLASLEDVATAPDGRLCLVLGRLTGTSLDRLLAERGALGAGEVVTIAATITTALQALHDSGFSHSMIGPACVRFDGRGRPVLLGLGALEDLPPGGAGAARRRDDLVRLAGCVRSILDHLDPHAPESATAPALLAEFEAAATTRPLPADLTGLEAALFDWAPAKAVRGAVPGTARVDAADPDEPEEPDELPGLAAAGGPLTRPARAPAEEQAPAVRGRGRLVRPWRAGIRSGAVTVRGWSRSAVMWARALRACRARPALVGVGLAGLLAAGGLAALSWAGAPGAAGDDDARPGSTALAAAAGPGTAGLSASLVADDPAAAALALLRLREGCLAEVSVLCLDGVDQAGSVAMAADSYLIRQEETGVTGSDAQVPPGAGTATRLSATGFTATEFTATVQERRGNAALIVLRPAAGGAANTQPASALVIKGEAGWRLRELFDY